MGAAVASARAQAEAFVNTVIDLDSTINASVNVSPETTISPTLDFSPKVDISPKLNTKAKLSLLSDITYKTVNNSKNVVIGSGGGVVVLVLMVRSSTFNFNGVVKLALALLAALLLVMLSAFYALSRYLDNFRRPVTTINASKTPDLEAVSLSLIAGSEANKKKIFKSLVENNVEATEFVHRLLLAGHIRYMVQSARIAAGNKIQIGDALDTELKRLNTVAAKVELNLSNQMHTAHRLLEETTFAGPIKMMKDVEETKVEEIFYYKRSWWSRFLKGLGFEWEKLEEEEAAKVSERLSKVYVPYVQKLFMIREEEEGSGEIQESLSEVEGATSRLYAALLRDDKYGGSAGPMSTLIKEIGFISSQMAAIKRDIEIQNEKLTAAKRQLVVAETILAAVDADANEWRRFLEQDVQRLEEKRRCAESEKSVCKNNEQRWTWLNWGRNADRDMYTRDINLMARRQRSLDGKIQDMDSQITKHQKSLSSSRDTHRRQTLVTAREEQMGRIEDARRKIADFQGPPVRSNDTLPEVTEGTLEDSKLNTLKAMYDVRIKKLAIVVKSSGGDMAHVERMQTILTGLEIVSNKADHELKIRHVPPAWTTMMSSVGIIIEDMKTQRIPKLLVKHAERLAEHSKAYTNSSVVQFLGKCKPTVLGEITSGDVHRRLAN